MFKIIESKGQKFELTVNSATPLLYKQIFKSEVTQELAGVDIKTLSQLSKKTQEDGQTQDEKEEKAQELLAQAHDILKLTDIFIKLGFVMIRQCLPFQDYWNRTSYDDYVEWRAMNSTQTLMTPEFIGGVAQLWAEDQKGNAQPKN